MAANNSSFLWKTGRQNCSVTVVQPFCWNLVGWCIAGLVIKAENDRRDGRPQVIVNVNVVYALKQNVLRGRRRPVWRYMGLQPISELFTTDEGWAQVHRQRVPDDGAATWKLRWPNRVLVRGTSMSQRLAEQRCHCHFRSVSDRHTDVPEVAWAGAADTVKSSYDHLVRDPLAHWQPMKHITKNWLWWCVETCRHRRPDGQQRSEPSAADGWPAPTRNAALIARLPLMVYGHFGTKTFRQQDTSAA